MATKPGVAIPEWATNSDYDDGPEVGTPTKIEPPTAQAEDGWRPGERPPAQYQNHWQHATGVWLGWAEESIDELEAADAAILARLGPTERAIYKRATSARLVTPGEWAHGNDTSSFDHVVANTDRAELVWTFSAGADFPWRGTISQVLVNVTPGEAGRDPSDAIAVRVYFVRVNGTVVSAGAANDGGATGNHAITIAPTVAITGTAFNGDVSETDNVNQILVVVEAGVSVGSPDDEIYFCRIATTITEH